MPSGNRLEDLAGFEEISKTHPKNFESFLKRTSRSMEPSVLERKTKKRTAPAPAVA